MDIFLVAYDLLHPDSKKKEDEISKAIKAFTGWWWHYGGVWLVAGNDLTAHKVYSRLANHFALEGKTPSDNLFIARITPSDTYGFLPKNAWDWLTQADTKRA